MTQNALFSSAPPPPGTIQRHGIFLTRCAEARERGDELAAKVALGTYLVLRAIDRSVEIVADPDPAEVEGFRWQLRSAINFVEALPKVECIAASHLDGIVRVIAEAARGETRRLRVELLAYCWHLEEAGQIEEGLDVLGAGAPFYRSAGEKAQGELGMTAGRLHRVLAQWDLADQGYQMGLEAAEARQDRGAILLARLGHAKVLLGRGNLPEARRQMEEIIEEAKGEDLADTRAWAYSDLAVVLEKQELPQTSLIAQYEAFCHFRDSRERCRALNNLGGSLRNLGALTGARIAFETVLRTTENFYLRANALVELTGIHGEMGDELGFRRYWQEAQVYKDRMPPTLGVDFEYRVGLGLVRFGKQAAGCRWLEDAQTSARRHSLNEWYFRLDTALKMIDAKHEIRRETPSLATESADSIARIETKLSDYAAMLAQ